MHKQPDLDPRFESLLDYLKRTRGFDFTGYKRASLMRRVEKRMQQVETATFSEYLDYLEVHPQEFDSLFNTILINVTSFFRDPDSWGVFAKMAIAPLVKRGEQIRVWCAGCATGQEAYSLAILLCEAMSPSEFQERVKLYATDVDESALAQARVATYDERALENLTEERREKYFMRDAGGIFAFRPDLRRSVIFGRHDLVQDAPISKLDLLTCRNTLMYLNGETQGRILARLHFALKPDGFLFLGRAEMLLSHANLFEPVDLQHRIFTKVNKTNFRDRLLVMAQAGDGGNASQYIDSLRLKEAAFEHSHIAQIVVDEVGVLSLSNEKARNMFDLNHVDVGRQFKDLELSYRPLELRSLIDQSVSERRIVKIGKVSRMTPSNQEQYLDIQICPLFDGSQNYSGVSICFEDVTDFHRLYDELRCAHEELETTNEELESTNEELETTNEELQSTNEELETTNEELQSTNEELETTNAELQSTNEELEATNSELRDLTLEVERTNNYLQSVMASMKYGVVVIDEGGKILVWNDRSEDLWGLRADEVSGKLFFDLDIGLEVRAVEQLIDNDGASSKGFKQMEMDAINRRGKSFTCRIRISPLAGKRQQRGFVLLFDDARDRNDEHKN